MIYFDEDFLEVQWDNEIKAVIMTWKKFVVGEPFRLGLNKGLELIIKQKAHKWLADLRKMKTLSIDDQNWSSLDWFPRAAKGGIRKMAIVIPESALANMGLKNIMSKVEDIDIETSYFPEISEAKAWLNS